MLAGSESRVMSLWPVSDDATRGLMVEYYKGLLIGRRESDALRKVQLDTGPALFSQEEGRT